MDKSTQDKWDGIYAKADRQPEPASVLEEYAHLLPSEGDGLEIACGLGGNAIFLAKRGLSTQAWDISQVAVDAINNLAEQASLNLSASVHDLSEQAIPKNAFDVIVVSYFLDRKLADEICDGLKPGGLLFYQTFVQDVTADYSGPRNMDFRLARGELLSLFSSLSPVIYREENLVGDIAQGLRNQAYFVGQKIAT